MKNRQCGITLIALVVTIIVMLILSGVVISLMIREDGLITKAQEAGKEYKEKEARERLELVLLDLQKDKITNKLYNESTYIDNRIIQEGMEINGNIVTVNGYKFEIDRSVPEIKGKADENEENNADILNEYSILEHFDKTYLVKESSVVLSNTQKKWGNNAAYFNDNKYIKCISGADTLAGDFTIDYWYYPEQQFTTGYVPHIDFGNGGLSFGINNGKFSMLKQGVLWIATDIPQMEANKWTHIAITRQGTTIYVFFDGVLKGKYGCAGNLSTTEFRIGRDVANNYLTNAYIDELRIISGVAKWTSDFNVPIEPYQNDEIDYIYHFDDYNELKTSKYECNYNISNDIKSLGSGSAYFNNRYLKMNSSDDLEFTGDFTIDYWYYQTSLTNIYSYHVNVNAVNGIWLGIDKGNFRFRTRGDLTTYTEFFETEQAPINTWTHVAMTRKDNIMYFFINGKLKGTLESDIVLEKGDLYLGYDSYNYTQNTYIDELRILKGKAVWTQDFIPQNQPYED